MSHSAHCHNNLNVRKHMVNPATIFSLFETIERRRLSLAGQQRDG
jgi:hypothetical protein